jgi:hypothetical protein
MMPGGQVAYVMAAAPGPASAAAGGGMMPHRQPPPPTDPHPSSVGPVRRSAAPSPRGEDAVNRQGRVDNAIQAPDLVFLNTEYAGNGAEYPPVRGGASAGYAAAASRGASAGYGGSPTGGYGGRGAAYGVSARLPSEGYVARGSTAPGGYGGGGRSAGHYDEGTSHDT